MKKLYFAYGSNLNMEQMKIRCPDSAGISPAVLSDWKLFERTYADIEECQGACVNGALYEISPADLAALDHYEGYPKYYTRREVMVTDSAGVYRKAWVYTMTEESGKHRDRGKYSDTYRKICSIGAEEWKIPNAFARQKEHLSTLWENGVPDIANGLAQMLDCLLSENNIPQAKRLWIGAGVIISLKPQKIKGDFYMAPIEIVTPHALELSWVFNDLRAVFVQAGVLNSINKFDFYENLAGTASCAIDNDSEIGAAELCRVVVGKAQEMYNEYKKKE